MIGIGVTTHNRPDLLDATLSAIREHTPNAYLVVVDDGSDDSAKVSIACDCYAANLVRHPTAQGIPAAKNACLAALMDAGCTELFLFDDDTRPVVTDWWKPYVESTEPHLCYCWTHFQNGGPVEKMDVLYRDSSLVAYGWSMGCMIYAHRSVIERVGGFHYGFGVGMEEHADFSQRAHNAGLTTFVHQDVADSGGLFWAGDEHCAVKRSLAVGDRTALHRKNEALRLSRIDFAGFEPYRPSRDVVLTSFYAGVDDAQRPRVQLKADKGVLKPLLDSVTGYETVVLNNCFDPCEGFEMVDVSCSPYQQRWINQLRWLRTHPEVRWVWMVDATDVKMLNEPVMEPGVLYAGYEPRTVGIPWIRQNSPAVCDWVDEHADNTLLNCGVVGGDRDTVMRLCQSMVDLHMQYQATPLHEMAFFNMSAYAMNVEYGPKVTSLFKHNERNEWSWWAHK